MEEGEGRGFSVGRALGEIFLEPWVCGVHKFERCPVEDDLAFINNDKFGAVIDTAVGDRLDLSGLWVEAISGQKIGILQTVGDDQRSGVGRVSLLDDEIDDGG